MDISLTKENVHRPPHLYSKNEIYFLYNRTFDKKHYFSEDAKKYIVRKILVKVIREFNPVVYAWVILNNHYHFLLEFKNKDDLGRFVKRFHSLTSLAINKLDNVWGRKVWYQYREKIIRDEKDFYTHFNYIHGNPIKHELVKN